MNGLVGLPIFVLSRVIAALKVRELLVFLKFSLKNLEEYRSNDFPCYKIILHKTQDYLPNPLFEGINGKQIYFVYIPLQV